MEILTRSDKEEAVQILCAAFRDYPVMRYVLRDSGAAYDGHLHALVGFFCERRLARGWPLYGLRVDGAVAAVAVVSEPVDRPWTPELRRCYDELKQTVGTAAISRLDRYDELTDQDVPDTPHHYLGMIGVHPEHQGRGYGKQLVEAVQGLAQADAASTGVCLNTETTDNLPFYERLGFKVVLEVDGEDLHTWCMFWPGERNGRKPQATLTAPAGRSAGPLP